MLLPSASYRVQHEARDTVRIAGGRLLHLAEARRVDVERLDVDRDFGLVEARRVRIQPLGRLRQRAGR